jgi:hypothetical protein
MRRILLAMGRYGETVHRAMALELCMNSEAAMIEDPVERREFRDGILPAFDEFVARTMKLTAYLPPLRRVVPMGSR